MLEEYGFEWDSSLMGRDFEPYYPRPVIIDLEQGDTWGDPTSVLEIPVSWYLDDWPSQEFVMGIQTGLASANVLYGPGRITSTTPASACRTRSSRSRCTRSASAGRTTC